VNGVDILAVAQFTPLFLAILICWIFSVCVHEFAHALVAYWGGDRSVVERGYLAFNPLAYIDPVGSLLIPAAFLMMGGLPLPGGAVRINRGALRGRQWSSLVSAAGPVSNFVLFLLLAAVLHPSVGVVDPEAAQQPTWVIVAGAMCVLEIFSVLFNLLPVPGFDGFGILEPYLEPKFATKARSFGLTPLILVYFVFSVDPVMHTFMDGCSWIMESLGLPFDLTWRFYNYALFGSSE